MKASKIDRCMAVDIGGNTIYSSGCEHIQYSIPWAYVWIIRSINAEPVYTEYNMKELERANESL